MRSPKPEIKPTGTITSEAKAKTQPRTAKSLASQIHTEGASHASRPKRYSGARLIPSASLMASSSLSKPRNPPIPHGFDFSFLGCQSSS